jgi:hypothetical protein
MSNTTASNDGVVFKITLERRNGTELRRVRGTFSFDEMSTVIRHMWNSAPKRLHVEYVDEDGDRVRVGSELEWSEALQHHIDLNQHVVRLFARRGRKGTDASVVEDSESESDRPDRTGTAPAVPRLNMPVVKHDDAPMSLSAPEAAMPRETTDVSAVMSREATEGTSEHENTIDLLSRLFDCDAAKEIQDMFSKVDFAPIVTRRVDAVAQEVHVDVDKIALRHFTVTRTNLWIGNGLYEKAESTLDAAMRVWPDDHIFEYNAACSSSLRGDLEKSLELLSIAVDHGYRNVQQLKRDPDLENARGHPDFSRVIDAARGDQVVVADAEPEVVAAPKEEKKAPEPKAASDVERFMAVFPHMSEAEAAAVLKRPSP